MAFNAANMVLVSHGANQKIYHYETTDTLAAVNTANYFDNFSSQLRTNDILFVFTGSTAPDHFRVYTVAVSSGVVTLTTVVNRNASFSS